MLGENKAADRITIDNNLFTLLTANLQSVKKKR
jgi:hypothetical protein